MTAFEEFFKAISYIESGGNPFAVRYEKHYVDRINDKDKALQRAKKYVYAFHPSLKSYLSFSVGRLQFMVYNLYFIDALYLYLKENQLLPITIPFVVNEGIERALFELFLKERAMGFYLKLKANALNDEDIKDFARIWNGSEEYAKKIKANWLKRV